MTLISSITGIYYTILVAGIISGIILIPLAIAYMLFITPYLFYAGMQMNKGAIKRNYFHNSSLRKSFFQACKFYKCVLTHKPYHF